MTASCGENYLTDGIDLTVGILLGEALLVEIRPKNDIYDYVQIYQRYDRLLLSCPYKLSAG
ncbi:MAG: hypothetical protein R3A45_05540 [Bdellovibrionota bacterium]